MKKVILFDMDGTIVDTERTAVEILKRYFEYHGHILTEVDLAHLVGRPWASAVLYLEDRYPLNKPPEVVEQEMLKEYRATFSYSLQVIPGSVEAIRALAKEFRLGLVSGSRRQDIETILAALKVRDLFEHVLGFEDYAEGKPSPIPYLDALVRFGVKADDAIIFEDSPAGIRSALDAKVRTVTVGESIKGAGVRPATPWKIPDFLHVDAAWVNACFAKKNPD